MASTLDYAAEQLARAASLLEGVGGNVQGAAHWLALLGWDLPPGVADIGLARIDASNVVTRLEELTALRGDESASELEVAAAVGEVVVALGTALDQLAALAEGFEATPDYLAATGIVDEFFPRLADLLVIQLVGAAAAPAVPIGILLGLFELTLLPADPVIFQVEHVRQVVRWDRIPQLFTDPGRVARDVYAWGTADFNADLLIGNVAMVLEFLAADSTVRPLPRQAEEQLSGRPVPEADADPATQLFVSLVKGPDQLDVGVTLYGLRASVAGGTDGGLGVSPYATGTTDTRFPLAERLSLVLEAAADIQGGLALVLRAGADPDLKTGLIRPATGTPGRVALSLELEAATDDRQLLLDLPGLRLDAASVSAGVGLGVGTTLNPTLTAAIKDGRLRVVPDQGDGFLATILPDDGVTAVVNLAISWSAEDGVRIDGGVGLTTSIGLHKTVGPLRLDTLDLTLAPAADAIALTGTITGAATLGPFEATVERVGVAAELRFERGNLGPVNLGAGFVPPSGIGVAFDAGPAVGGGFLAFDPERREYAGALELQLGKIGVKAIGVLSTGPGDWSLLLLLYAQVPPIQLGFGFTLEGIGGLIGLHRGVDLPQLIAGMQNGAFDDILFPADPVGDAPRILGRLRALFPARARSLTIGPMVDVHWGKPLILTARLAILLQLDNALGSAGGPLALTRVVLVGQLRVAVGPTEEDPYARVVQLTVDVLGFWDLADKRYGFVAALRDSSVAGIDITGGLGVWGEYGQRGRFLLAAGGFNPRFQDIPAQLSGVLSRLGGAFSVGRFDLVLSGYFALTPATIQAGLNLRATAAIGSVRLTGDIGFDVLIYRRPRTHFIADFHVIVEVSYRGHTLAGVKVTGTIEGPSRWHLVGKATFSILWWDISVPFDESWGTPAPLLIDQVDVGGLLGAALALRENWSAQLPVGGDAMVTLAPRRGDPAPRAHPLGRFVFSQQVAPLGLTLEKFGDSAVTGPNHFDVESVTIGGRPIAETAPGASHTPVREHFARAQFLEMTEEDRLTRPAFEEMDAGVEFSPAAFEVGARLRVDMAYETAYLDLETRQTRPEPRAGVRQGALDDDLVQGFGRYGAAGRAPQRATERMASVRLPIAVSAPLVAAADRRTLHAVALDGPATAAQMVVEQRIQRAGAVDAQLVEAFELAGA